VPEYKDNIKQFLEAPTSNTENRIRELDLEDLLTYNGMDSLVEYRVALKQSKQLKLPIL
jgi:hypothetical protein